MSTALAIDEPNMNGTPEAEEEGADGGIVNVAGQTKGESTLPAADLASAEIVNEEETATELRFGPNRELGDPNASRKVEPPFTLEPLEFNEHTHDTMPSISPRDPLEDVEDKKLYKEFRRFQESNKCMNKLILAMQKDILTVKPDSILDYLVDVWFAEENYKERHRQFYG